MTEQDWLKATRSTEMREYLKGKASHRKLRLFGVACCRRAWHLLPDERSRTAVEVAEQFCDGAASDRQREVASEAAREASYAVGGREFSIAQEAVDVVSGNIQKTIGCLGTGLPHAIADYACLQQVGAARYGSLWSARLEVERANECDLLRDIFGNPFRPVRLDAAWRTPAVMSLARAAYEERILPAGHLDQQRLSVLADALEEAGCVDQTILDHLRGPGPHTRGCWPVDLVLARE